MHENRLLFLAVQQPRHLGVVEVHDTTDNRLAAPAEATTLLAGGLLLLGDGGGGIAGIARTSHRTCRRRSPPNIGGLLGAVHVLPCWPSERPALALAVHAQCAAVRTAGEGLRDEANADDPVVGVVLGCLDGDLVEPPARAHTHIRYVGDALVAVVVRPVGVVVAATNMQQWSFTQS